MKILMNLEDQMYKKRWVSELFDEYGIVLEEKKNKIYYEVIFYSKNLNKILLNEVTNHQDFNKLKEVKQKWTG